MRNLSLYLAALTAAMAPGISLAQDARELGSVDSFVTALKAQQANPVARFNLAMGADSLAVEIEHLHDRNGQVSITGRALESKNSLFFVKGSRERLRGYLVLHDKRKAYEYRTDARGMLSVVEVPITQVFPDFDEGFQKSNRSTATAAELAAAHPVYSPMALRQAPHIGAYANQDVTKLESKPGKPWVFYLNTTAVMSGSTPLNGVTKEQMYRAWQSVADQYSMLQMNVTTNRAVYDAARAANPLRTGIINFVNQDGRSYAPVHSFGTTAAGTLFRNPSSGFDYGYGIGMTAAHEVGHQMGMLHDGGGSGGEYYEGIAAYQWGPIMGNYWLGGSWANQLFTWSKGEYSTASNQEDDLRIMTVEESVPYADDDNTASKPLVLRAGGAIHPSDNWGQIERNTDTDVFTFTVAAPGTLNLRIDPIEYLRMLDVDVTLTTEAGQQVARSNLAVHRSAEFKNLNLPVGNYRLVVQGGAEGTPQKGFSKYSSLGYYAMQGTLTGATTPNDPPLTSGVPLANQAAATGGWLFYTIQVPAGTTRLNVAVNGANGDADLFVANGVRPTSSSYACKSDGPTSVESCSVTSPAAGTYVVGIYAYTGFSGLTVTATAVR